MSLHHSLHKPGSFTSWCNITTGALQGHNIAILPNKNMTNQPGRIEMPAFANLVLCSTTTDKLTRTQYDTEYDILPTFCITLQQIQYNTLPHPTTQLQLLYMTIMIIHTQMTCSIRNFTR